jgi:hypothetical protein
MANCHHLLTPHVSTFVLQFADSIGLPTDEGLFGFKPFAEQWCGRLAMMVSSSAHLAFLPTCWVVCNASCNKLSSNMNKLMFLSLVEISQCVVAEDG